MERDELAWGDAERWVLLGNKHKVEEKYEELVTQKRCRLVIRGMIAAYDGSGTLTSIPFNVRLQSIRVIRALFGLGLKEAKEIVDAEVEDYLARNDLPF